MKKHIFTFAVCLCAIFAVSNIASATIIIVPPPTPVLPTTIDQCKKGGWQNFGGIFKNQGDCVSFVATGGKNQPSGVNN